ncbi:hypothetical protein WR25_25557 [Diploscapter pachys]|uniref:BPTI/Kunitz inhibitor domain-containing protein n=1 Tax=Diploscapter pachys TaxID=2018661 RepID=A0A2A2M3Y4_9BILA|nr:hypothetical protein WR25_25557 [Diploscapter pachys]
MRFFLIVALFVVFAFVSAHNSNSTETTSKESSEKQTSSKLHPCQQPITVGPCRALIKRWAFDQKTKKCSEFGYGGCQGNENNFKTLGECQKTCETK